MLMIWIIKPGLLDFMRGIRIETVSDMQYQNKLSTQEPVRLQDSSLSMILPPNSVAVNHSIYRFNQYQYDSATSRYSNPLPDNDELVLARGKNRFEVFCVPCHNDDGKGMGLMITKPKLKPDEEGFPQPADLTSERTKGLSDSRIYHILSAGQNLMFPVNEKLNNIDKWCVVKYIRFLQGK